MIKFNLLKKIKRWYSKSYDTNYKANNKEEYQRWKRERFGNNLIDKLEEHNESENHIWKSRDNIVIDFYLRRNQLQQHLLKSQHDYLEKKIINQFTMSENYIG